MIEVMYMKCIKTAIALLLIAALTTGALGCVSSGGDSANDLDNKQTAANTDDVPIKVYY